MFSQRLNHFLVCSGCDKIISPYAQHSCTMYWKNVNHFYMYSVLYSLMLVYLPTSKWKKMQNLIVIFLEIILENSFLLLGHKNTPGKNYQSLICSISYDFIYISYFLMSTSIVCNLKAGPRLSLREKIYFDLLKSSEAECCEKLGKLLLLYVKTWYLLASYVKLRCS